LLYRWFVGLNIEDKVWDHSTFTANRERLFNEDLARAFFERVTLSAQWSRLASDEHFSVDGTLIEAWASHRSFKRKDDDSGTPPGRNTEMDSMSTPVEISHMAEFTWSIQRIVSELGIERQRR
jgi:hypothetical protein